MHNQFVSIRYNGQDILLTGRGTDDKRRTYVVHGFEPYFYCAESDDLGTSFPATEVEYGHKNIYGHDLKKISAKNPKTIKYIREVIPKSYEADVPFTRRFLIDKKITSGFEAPNSQTVFHEDIKTSDFSCSPLTCYFDLEIESYNRIPNPNSPNEKLIAITWYDTKTKQYVTVIVDENVGQRRLEPDWILLVVPNERILIEKFASYLRWLKPDCFENWNLFFDTDYLRARAQVLNIRINIDTTAHFDLLSGYKRVFAKASNHLKDVVIEEKIADKVVASKFHISLYNDMKGKFLKLGKDAPFIQYSKDDVYYIEQLEQKHHLRDYYWDFRNYIGTESVQSVMTHGVKVDVMLLRLCSGRFALDTKQVVEGETFRGAIVFEPTAGIINDVAVFDMSRYYPSIILSAKLSPERNDGKGILCELTNIFVKERQRYDELLAKLEPGTEEYESVKQKWQVVKNMLNSIWGYVGWTGSRIYNRDIAATITRIAREGLEHIATTIGEEKVIYGDTDSIFVQIPKEDAERTEDEINQSMKLFARKNNYEELFKVNFEKFASRIVFVEAKGGGGAKKKYCANWTYMKGKEIDEVEIKGFDAIRRDNSVITKTLQRNVLEDIARGNVTKVSTSISTVINKMRNNEYPIRDIALTKTLNKNLDEYKGNPDFVRAVKYANEFNNAKIQGGDMIKMLHVIKIPGLPPTNVFAFTDESEIPKGTQIDIEKMIDKTIKGKLENIVKVAGFTWEDVAGGSLVKVWS